MPRTERRRLPRRTIERPRPRWRGGLQLGRHLHRRGLLARSGSSDVSQVAPTCGAPTTYNVPSNGAIYSNETVIIGGTGTAASTVNGRVTVTSNNDIVIGNNISLPARDTNSVLGLVALNDMIVAYWAPNNLTWWAATIATTGQWTDTCGAFDATGAARTGR